MTRNRLWCPTNLTSRDLEGGDWAMVKRAFQRRKPRKKPRQARVTSGQQRHRYLRCLPAYYVGTASSRAGVETRGTSMEGAGIRRFSTYPSFRGGDCDFVQCFAALQTRRQRPAPTSHQFHGNGNGNGDWSSSPLFYPSIIFSFFTPSADNTTCIPPWVPLAVSVEQLLHPTVICFLVFAVCDRS